MVLLASNYDQSRFFKAEDVTAEKKLKIKAVTEEEIGIGNDKERKLVVWFTNDKRGLVLNRVNNRTIRGAYGDLCDGWIGKVIILFPAQAEFRGTMKPALRVRIPTPKDNAQHTATIPAALGPALAPAEVDPAEIPLDDALDEDAEIVI
jgi:hypothetical protein